MYLGNVPDDVELVALQLNENTFRAPLMNSSTYTVAIAVHVNRTYGYTLKVPFDDPSVVQQVKGLGHNLSECFVCNLSPFFFFFLPCSSLDNMKPWSIN